MGRGRIVFQNWIVELGHDPIHPPDFRHNPVIKYNNRNLSAVSQAMEQLTEEESGFIRQFYFQGLSYKQIAKATGRALHRLESTHNQAIKKLRCTLAGKLNLNSINLSEYEQHCPLCSHQSHAEINRLIQDKKKQETWHHIIRRLRDLYGIHIKTPQTLIGHQKYHIKEKS